MTSVALPTVPDGVHLEDYIAAFLNCGGFFTEKSLVESGEAQVLELDILAWKPCDQPPSHDLFEVKGGKWGFADIFKVYGWKNYLHPRGVSTAHMIAPSGGREAEILDYTREKCADIGVTLVDYVDLGALDSKLKDLGLTPPITNSLDHTAWRFSFWLERQMQRVVSNHRNSLKDLRSPQEVYEYQELIRNGLLQARDVRERLASLYQAHLVHPFLAKSVAAELDGFAWDADNPPDSQRWQDALYHSKHPLVQASMYYQHRARLDILKGAVEYALLQRHGALPVPRSINFLGFQMQAEFLPSNFNLAVQRLLNIDGFERVPLLWQSFLWKWGGFFLSDNETEEKSVLAEEIGVTTQALEEAFSVYDTLFPTSNGWFTTIQGTKLLKLFPSQFRGLGAHYRLQRLGKSEFGETFHSSTHRYLVSNLVQWNNSSVGLLSFGSPQSTQ